MRASHLLITLLVTGCGDRLVETTHADGGPAWLPPHGRNDLGPVAPDIGPLIRDALCLCDTPSHDRQALELDRGTKLDQQPKLDAACKMPSYPSDCSQVSQFQCGFMATCTGSVVTAQWHEHVMCGGHDNIVGFTCTYSCPGTCVQASAWPKHGAELVQQYCK